MAKKTSSNMIPVNFVNRLIHTYPNSIVTDSEGNLCFEETVYNFAIDIVDNMPASQQRSALGTSFDDYDELYNHLIAHFFDLRELLENQINN
jgi:hypothetical protein